MALAHICKLVRKHVNPVKGGDMQQTILVVEDQWSVRKFAMMALGTRGYTILEAENGVQALACLDNHDVDLVLTDWNMPGINGYELLEKIQQGKKHSGIPIVVMSALQKPPESQLPEAHNICCWLRKPCRISVIHSVVAEILDSRLQAVAH